MTEPLIRDYEAVDLSALEDLIMVMAKTIENSMIQAGATPGEDYSYVDLYKLAQPYALEFMKKNESITFSAGS